MNIFIKLVTKPALCWIVSVWRLAKPNILLTLLLANSHYKTHVFTKRLYSIKAGITGVSLIKQQELTAN